MELARCCKKQVAYRACLVYNTFMRARAQVNHSRVFSMTPCITRCFVCTEPLAELNIAYSDPDLSYILPHSNSSAVRPIHEN